MRLTAAAYLIAETSVSADRLLLSSATTRRPSAPSPSTETRSRAAPPAGGSPSNSKVTTLTAGPRMAGFDSTHSCRSARCSSPASSSEIICAGIATEPATVKSISSAISQSRVGQTVVFPQVPKVTRATQRNNKTRGQTRVGRRAEGSVSPHVRDVRDPEAASGHRDRTPPLPRRKAAATPKKHKELCKLCLFRRGRRPGSARNGRGGATDDRRLRSAPPARRAATGARARRPGPGRAAVARRGAGR